VSCERSKIAMTTSWDGGRVDFTDWDDEPRTPVSRTETRSCFTCGTEYTAYIDVSEVREAEGSLRAGRSGEEPYATKRRCWRETTTLEAHHCQPQPRFTEVTACQFTRMGRGLVSSMP
jgi:hypothetical protein